MDGGHAYAMEKEDSDISDARIPNQLVFMGEQLEILTKMLVELKMRLTPISIPERKLEDVNRADAPSIPQRLTSPLSDQIDEHNNHIVRLQVMVGDIDRRIQL